MVGQAGELIRSLEDSATIERHALGYPNDRGRFFQCENTTSLQLSHCWMRRVWIEQQAWLDEKDRTNGHPIQLRFAPATAGALAVRVHKLRGAIQRHEPNEECNRKS